MIKPLQVCNDRRTFLLIILDGPGPLQLLAYTDKSITLQVDNTLPYTLESSVDSLSFQSGSGYHLDLNAEDNFDYARTIGTELNITVTGLVPLTLYIFRMKWLNTTAYSNLLFTSTSGINDSLCVLC